MAKRSLLSRCPSYTRSCLWWALVFAMINLWVTAKCHFATRAQYLKQLGSNQHYRTHTAWSQLAGFILQVHH